MGVIGMILFEFHEKVIEVLVAEYVIWSTCDPFSRNARVTQDTRHIELE